MPTFTRDGQIHVPEHLGYAEVPITQPGAITDAMYEEYSSKCVSLLDDNWALVSSMVRIKLGVALSKREAIHVARLALEKMEMRY